MTSERDGDPRPPQEPGRGIVVRAVSAGRFITDAIVVEGLTKSYGEFVALRDVSFTVEAGTVFGLLGPNGAGKTTAIRILATVLKPSGGRATILGTDVVRQPNRVRFDIGLAGQFAAVDEQLTGRENLRLVGRLAQLRPKLILARADELLERFGLSDAANKPVKSYSGGMRRRLDIASALVQRPRVLFPGRADYRPRLAEPGCAVGHDPRARSRRDHGVADDPVPRGGRSAG